MISVLPCPVSAAPAGLRNGDFEEVVENNATIYGLNAVVLATFAGLAAYNPGFVSLTLWAC
jgi:hypothetical protein